VYVMGRAGLLLGVKPSTPAGLVGAGSRQDSLRARGLPSPGSQQCKDPRPPGRVQQGRRTCTNVVALSFATTSETSSGRATQCRRSSTCRTWVGAGPVAKGAKGQSAPGTQAQRARPEGGRGAGRQEHSRGAGAPPRHSRHCRAGPIRWRRAGWECALQASGRQLDAGAAPGDSTPMGCQKQAADAPFVALPSTPGWSQGRRAPAR
jgi:hypothetical protein